MRRHWEASSPEKVSGRRAGAFFRVETEVPRIFDTPPASINDRKAFIRDRIRKSDQQDWKFRHSISDRTRWIWMGTYVLFMWGCIWALRQNILVERPTGPELAWRAGLALAAATVPLSVAQAVGHCRWYRSAGAAGSGRAHRVHGADLFCGFLPGAAFSSLAAPNHGGTGGVRSLRHLLLPALPDRLPGRARGA
ncbi:unnamed protein product, partial [Heterosigma akashiwo]